MIGHPRGYFLDADVSADGLRMVRVEGVNNATRARVDTLDLASGNRDRAFMPKRA